MDEEKEALKRYLSEMQEWSRELQSEEGGQGMEDGDVPSPKGVVELGEPEIEGDLGGEVGDEEMEAPEYYGAALEGSEPMDDEEEEKKKAALTISIGR